MLENIQVFSGTEVKLEYLLTGEKNSDTIIFVHGAGSNLRQFIRQHEYFSEKFRVLSISLRGHGNSSGSKDNISEQYTLEKNRDDILELLEYLRIEKIHYVGNSAGGLIGYELINKCPELFLNFITFGTTAELKIPNFAVNLISLLDRIMMKISPKGYCKYISKQSSKYTDVQERIYSMLIDAREGILIRKNIGRYSYLNTLQKLNVPFLLIKGEFDQDINKNLNTTIEVMNKNPNAYMTELKEAGHFSNLDQPQEFNKIVENFIEKR